MVFLFPGILFRRTFFSGKFSKHYDSGNIVDRVLWNIFFSIICILLFILVNIFTDNILISSLGISLRQNEVINTFEELYKNEFPKLLRDSKSVNDFIWILLSLYIFSTLLGFGLHKLIFIFDLDKHIPLLKFQSKWDYLLVSNKESNKEHRLGDVFFTQADVKLLVRTSKGEVISILSKGIAIFLIVFSEIKLYFLMFLWFVSGSFFAILF